MIGSTLDKELGAALLAALMLRSPVQQFAAIWLGLLLGTIWEQGLLGVRPFIIGDGQLQDSLWICFLAVRCFTLIHEWTLLGVGRFLSRNK